MREFDIGQKVKYTPNPKVEPWTCKIIEKPPVKSATGKKLDRYKVRTLAPENIAGEEVNLEASELTPVDAKQTPDEVEE